jgi:hypothetical protein
MTVDQVFESFESTFVSIFKFLRMEMAFLGPQSKRFKEISKKNQ